MLGEAEMAESERNSLISEVEESISYVSASANGNSVPEKVATECQIYPSQYHDFDLYFFTPPPLFSFSNGNSRAVFLFYIL